MEHHVRFVNRGASLLGMLFTPDDPIQARDAGILFLHGWAGYRIGPHQMFTKMARRALAMGFPSLAFDFWGRGDSEGDADKASLSTMISDAQCAARTLTERTGVKRIVLVGVCSGGEVAIGAGPLIPECDAMVLWSVPQVAADRSHADRAKRVAILKEYWRKLFRRETWRKLLSGTLNLAMIRRAILRGGKGEGEEAAPEDHQIDWRARFLGFRGDIFYIYGSNDPTTADCIAYYERLSKEAGRPFRCHVVEGANHSFYSLKWEAEVLDKSLAWLNERYPQATQPAQAAGRMTSQAPA